MKSPKVSGLNLSAIENLLNEPEHKGFFGYLKRHWVKGAVGVFVLLLAIGIFAKNDWLPRTDPLSGKRTGWFGTEISKNAPSNWNLFLPPSSTPTPQLTKEYIHAGSRLLSVVDKGATEIPPADLAVWRPTGGEWLIMGTGIDIEYGQLGDVPVQGDYDGDGKTDFSVVRASPTPVTWRVLGSTTGSTSTPWGSPGDVPAVGDYDGDGKTDIAVWRPSGTGAYYWYVLKSSTGTMASLTFSGITSGDIPAPGDYDGDGKTDLAIWRSSNHTFYSINSSDGQPQSVSVGSTGDTPVPADYDGDGKADYAVLSGNVWKIYDRNTTSTNNTPWQTAGYTPVPNDYDGDGKVDIAEFHIAHDPKNPTGVGYGVWKIRQSHDVSTRTELWGIEGDVPVPAYYRH